MPTAPRQKAEDAKKQYHPQYKCMKALHRQLQLTIARIFQHMALTAKYKRVRQDLSSPLESAVRLGFLSYIFRNHLNSVYISRLRHNRCSLVFKTSLGLPPCQVELPHAAVCYAATGAEKTLLRRDDGQCCGEANCFGD